MISSTIGKSSEITTVGGDRATGRRHPGNFRQYPRIADGTTQVAGTIAEVTHGS
jgi:hypothetical protein